MVYAIDYITFSWRPQGSLRRMLRRPFRFGEDFGVQPHAPATRRGPRTQAPSRCRLQAISLIRSVPPSPLCCRQPALALDGPDSAERRDANGVHHRQTARAGANPLNKIVNIDEMGLLPIAAATLPGNARTASRHDGRRRSVGAAARCIWRLARTTPPVGARQRLGLGERAGERAGVPARQISRKAELPGNCLPLCHLDSIGFGDDEPRSHP